MINPFFKNFGPFTIDKIFDKCHIKNTNQYKDDNIFNICDLSSACHDDISFFHNRKYEAFASKTKAKYCVVTKNLTDLLPSSCKPIITDNVLITIAKITNIFYPESINDNYDQNVEDISVTTHATRVKSGKNVLIGENVTIGNNCMIGHNSIIESNVVIGNNCSIGSNVIIRNTIIKDNVHILDGCVIGKKGFGFFPGNNKNIRFPHIGIVIIEDNCEIGCGSTIDRGSLSNTTIGKNTYLDNQVHIAHNNKIGNNCIIAGQVGLAGSSTLGNHVMIGGQAGVSGHLNIGNYVQIAGGSGVIKDVKDNSKVMGYPARDLRQFIKDNK